MNTPSHHHRPPSWGWLKQLGSLTALLAIVASIAMPTTSPVPPVQAAPAAAPVAAPADALADSFPLGIFDDGNMIFGKPANFDRLIRDSQAQGLDTVLFNNNSAIRDEAMLSVSDSLGFNVIFGPQAELHSQWYDVGVPATIAQARTVVYPLVDRVKAHPSVKGYNVADEPHNEQTDKVRYATQAFQERDPARRAAPLVIGVNRGDQIFAASGANMLLADVYPVGADNPPCNFMMTGFGYPTFTFADYVRRMNANRPANKPLWLVLQTHNVGTGGAYSLRTPSVPEVRAQHWMALGEGATGIFWYAYSSQQGWTGLKDNPTLFAEIGAQAARTRPLRSTFLGLHRVDDQFITSGAPGAYISTMTTADSSKQYAVVVNTSSCSSATPISVLAPTLSGRLKDVETGEIFDLGTPIPFEPGDGKLFELVPFPPQAGPTPTPAGMGPNVVVNGDFTSATSGFPSGWQVRPSASWDGTVGRNAPGSFKISGASSTYSQSPLTVRPGASYLLTYWIKTENVTGQGATMRFVQLQPSTAILKIPPPVNGTTDWTSVVTTLNVPSTWAGGRLDIQWDIAGGNVWLDDIVLAELGYTGGTGSSDPPTATPTTAAAATSTPSPTATATKTPTSAPATATPTKTPTAAPPTATPASVNLVTNGNFSTPNGTFPANWQARPSGSWDSTTGHAAAGSLKVSGSADTYSFQGLQLIAGKSYRLSFWVKTQGVVGKGIAMRYPQTSPSTQIFGLTNYTTGTSNWTQQTATFTLPATFAGGRLDILWDMTSGAAWIDDVVLTQLP
ncbi:MAG: carbohydrate binding domain-containing protein [Chloroflexi bacterium]|nr:carbohydrate binding domain-containing protein [Chloroflexota bacterium]